MQLSKQEFSKLSKKEQQKLASVKGKPKAGRTKQRKNTQPSVPQRGGSRLLPGEATGVASAYSKGVKGNKPIIVRSAKTEAIRVIHKEFVQNVAGTTNFTVPIALALNPGLVASFPWLSSIANNYEQYRVNKMQFCYLTRTGTNIPGSVLMAPDYDAVDAPPSSEQIMANYQDIAEDAPWKDICCVLSPSGMHALGPKKFVRRGAVSSTDIKTYDVGNFFLATVDGTAVNWGKLWVEYDISFYVPQLNPQGPSDSASGGSFVGGGTLSAANPLGTTPVTHSNVSGISIDNTSTVTFTNLGYYSFYSGVEGTTITAVSLTRNSGCSLVSSFDIIDGTGANLVVNYVLNVISFPATAQLSVTAATVSSSDIVIGQLPVGSA